MHSEVKQAEMSELGAEKDVLWTKQGERVAWVEKPELPVVLGEKFLWVKFGVRATECVTFFWLIGGEVTGDVLGISAFWFQAVWGLCACM